MTAGPSSLLLTLCNRGCFPQPPGLKLWAVTSVVSHNSLGRLSPDDNRSLARHHAPPLDDA